MDEKKSQILGKLKEDYESREHNVHLLENYREKFRLNIQCLCNQLQNESIQKCFKIIQESETLKESDRILAKYNKRIEEEMMSLLEHCNKCETLMGELELQKDFKTMWTRTLTNLNIHQPAEEIDIEADIEQILREHMPTQWEVISDALKGKAFSHLGLHVFDVMEKHIDKKSWIKRADVKQAQSWSTFLEEKSKHDMDETAKNDMDCRSKYFDELLRDLDKKIEIISNPEFKMSEIYKAEFKLHMSGYAARRFKAMHQAFANKYNPLNRNAIFKNLGQMIVTEMKRNDPLEKYGNRNNFTVALLVHLRKEDSFEQFRHYIWDFENFAKDWLRGLSVEYCETESVGESKFIKLSKVILKRIAGEAINVMRGAITKNFSGEAKSLIELFVDKLKSKLGIPKDSLKLVFFQVDNKTGYFAKMALMCIEQTVIFLLQELANWVTKPTIKELPVQPGEEIFLKIFSCTKKCTFCKVHCEAETARGFVGYRWLNNRRLQTDTCTSLVATVDYYRSWLIPKSPGAEADTYWKKVFYTFHKEFAERYRVEPADINPVWNVPWETVKVDLSKAYNVPLESIELNVTVVTFHGAPTAAAALAIRLLSPSLRFTLDLKARVTASKRSRSLLNFITNQCYDFSKYDVQTAVVLTEPPTLTRKPGEALRLTCKTSGFNLATSSRYWYRQLPGKQRESLLGYHSASNKYFVAGIEIRVTVIKDFPNNIFVLIIKSLTGTQVVETPRGRGPN
eukprot:gi/632988368/ref/XP_007883073.1/ PREDICTED: interferon-induced very large GTPase 1-like [Callorhinchus milii]